MFMILEEGLVPVEQGNGAHVVREHAKSFPRSTLKRVLTETSNSMKHEDFVESVANLVRFCDACTSIAITIRFSSDSDA